MIFFDEPHDNERLQNRPNGITMGAPNAPCQKETS
ncbi:hypothetical protein R54767_01512 [Paraburkholderia gardini]|jgi:hypothetical protein|uniref:Uncharacterized protein n=1 Tax=Paraburkholderia gardini TaxID=2823469 RepID=A0ABM8U137_9BURK|nr:hypothetical protein R54767_01512 [Paraburkholderia gardini]